MPRPSSPSPPLILVIDAGATRTRAAVLTAEGRRLGVGLAAAGNRMAAGARAGKQIVAAARLALRHAGIGGGAIAAWTAGVAGIGYDGAGSDAIARDLARLLPHARSRVTADVDLALEGALGAAAGARPCLVVVSGTGSIVLGRGARAETVRAGGWGWLLGDEGSGQWFGRQAIAAAARAFDGSGPATDLTAVVRRGLGLRTLGALAPAVYRPVLSPAELGALAPPLLRVAARGDLVARSIVRVGMAALAGQAVAVLRRLRAREPALASPALVAAQGSVFRAGEIVFTPLREELRRLARAAGAGAVEWREPELPPLGGAFRIALAELGFAPSAAALVRVRAILR